MNGHQERSIFADGVSSKRRGLVLGLPSARDPDGLTAVGVPILLIVLALLELPAEPTWTICGFANLTGLPCPGCGMTRGLSALLHGDVVQAIRFNPLCLPTALGLGWLWWKAVCRLGQWSGGVVSMERVVSGVLHRIGSWSLWLAVGVFWAWRWETYLETYGVQKVVRDGWIFRLFSLVTDGVWS